MHKAAKVVLTAAIAAGFVAAEAPAQSSSNPFSGISGLFSRSEKPVTDENGRVLGPPVDLSVVVVDGDEDDTAFRLVCLNKPPDQISTALTDQLQDLR